MSLIVKSGNTYEESVKACFESIVEGLAPEIINATNRFRDYPKMSEYDAIVQACILAALFFGGDDIESLRARFDEAVFECAQRNIGFLPFVFDAADRAKCN